MSYSIVHNTTQTGTGTQTVTIPSTTNGNVLVVMASNDTNALSTTGVSGGGVTTWTSTPTSNDFSMMYYGAITSSSTSVTITPTVNGGATFIQVLEWSGVNTSTILDQGDGANNHGNSTNPATNNLTTVNTGALVIALYVHFADTGNPTSNVAGWTDLTEFNNGSGGQKAAWQTAGAPATFNDNWTTAGSGGWRAVIASFQAAAVSTFLPVLGSHFSPVSQPLEATLLQRL